MKTTSMLRFVGALLVAPLLAFGPLAHAQAQGDVDPPGRVGRLADVEGKAWIFDTQSGEWVEAARNRPLTTTDRLSTDNGAHAEIRIGPTVLRLDGGSDLEVLQLDDARIRLQLHDGSLAVRAASGDAANGLEVVTDEGRFIPQRAGYYRVDRDDNNVSAATVWEGAMHFETNDSALDIAPGQRAQFWRDGPTHYTMGEVQNDAFGNWARARDAADSRIAVPRYVSPEMTGYEDLDRNGNWQTTTEYGPVWTPTVVTAGWAPYRYGHWAWVSPWGWSWVDDAPWGFAPFHYGRWVWFRSRWCWSPGTYVARPVYAPALVAWVGGSNVSVSVTIGSRGAPPVGWFPLAPREVYVPAYRHSPTYVRNVNVTQVTNITIINQAVQRPPAHYANHRRDFDAVTVVPADVVQHRRAVAPALLRGNEAQAVASQTVVRREAPIAPIAPAGRGSGFVPGRSAIPTPPGRGVEAARAWNREPSRDAQRDAQRDVQRDQPGRDRDDRGGNRRNVEPGVRPTPSMQVQQPQPPQPQQPQPQQAAQPVQQRPAPAQIARPERPDQPEGQRPMPTQRVIPPPPRSEATHERRDMREQREPREPREERGRQPTVQQPMPAPQQQVQQQAPRPQPQPQPQPQVQQRAPQPQAQPQPQPQAQPQPQVQQPQPEGHKQIPRTPEGHRQRENAPQGDRRDDQRQPQDNRRER